LCSHCRKKQEADTQRRLDKIPPTIEMLGSSVVMPYIHTDVDLGEDPFLNGYD